MTTPEDADVTVIVTVTTTNGKSTTHVYEQTDSDGMDELMLDALYYLEFGTQRLRDPSKIPVYHLDNPIVYYRPESIVSVQFDSIGAEELIKAANARNRRAGFTT